MAASGSCTLLLKNVLRPFVYFAPYFLGWEKLSCEDENLNLNPLMPGGNKKVTHTSTNLHLSVAGSFKYVWSFYDHQALKGSLVSII